MTLLFLCFFLAFQTFFLAGGEPLTAGREYSFADRQEWMELKGFAPPEKGGRWTRGGRAAILLKVEDPELLRDSRFEFDLTPFSAPGRETLQRATLYCGYTSNRPAASWKCTGRSICSFVPRMSDVKDGVLTVFLFLPDAVPSYSSEGAVNPRSLGLFFRSVTLIRKKPFVPPEEQKTAPVPKTPVSAPVPKMPFSVLKPVPVPESPVPAPPPVKRVQAKPVAAELPVMKENQWYSLSENSRFFRLSGFSVPERDGRWTSGTESEIEMRLPDLGEMPLPAFEFRIAVPRNETRTASLLLNGLGIGQWICRETDGYYKVLLGSLSRSGGTVRLHFSVPDAGIPAGLENVPGARKLGIRILALRLIPDGRGPAAEMHLQEKHSSVQTRENLIELSPGKKVLPGRNGKRLLLEGFSAPEPDGGVSNIGKKCLVTFRVPALFRKETSVAVLEVEPVLAPGIPVRYVNVLVDGHPVDSWASVKRTRHYLRLNGTETTFVTVTLDLETGTEQKAEKGFRLLGVTLFDRRKKIPMAQMDRENEAYYRKKQREEQAEKQQFFQKENGKNEK